MATVIDQHIMSENKPEENCKCASLLEKRLVNQMGKLDGRKITKASVPQIFLFRDNGVVSSTYTEIEFEVEGLVRPKKQKVLHSYCPYCGVKINKGSEPDQYYIQDTRQFVGNCIIFWTANKGGYTTKLAEAGKYSKEEAERITANRSSDKAWPCNHIDSIAERTVDDQRKDYSMALGYQN